MYWMSTHFIFSRLKALGDWCLENNLVTKMEIFADRKHLYAALVDSGKINGSFLISVEVSTQHFS